jgi:hypothetical protein
MLLKLWYFGFLHHVFLQVSSSIVEECGAPIIMVTIFGLDRFQVIIIIHVQRSMVISV